jgi:hypothetical protein
MDAPPPQEDVRPFVHVAGLIANAGLHAPRVLQADTTQGFLLLTDLGDRQYLPALQAATDAQCETLMRAALSALVRWQLHVVADSLPVFDAAQIARELDLFPEWCVQAEFGQTWNAAQQTAWTGVVELLTRDLLAQPAVAVHSDWMPRNLMVCDEGPGILDFQDAVRGPISYDLASLLRDAFLSWDEPRQIDWAVRWWEQARAAGLPVDATLASSGASWSGPACSATCASWACSAGSSTATASRPMRRNCRASSAMPPRWPCATAHWPRCCACWNRCRARPSRPATPSEPSSGFFH